jgi:cell division protease FtsH
MIILFTHLYSFFLNKENPYLLRVSNKNIDSNIKICKIINLLIENKIKKIWICNDYKKIFFQKKNNNLLYTSNIEPILINKIIDGCINNKIDFIFIKYIKSNILQTFSKDLNFFINKILLRLILMYIMIYLASVLFYAFMFLSENNGVNNLFGNINYYPDKYSSIKQNQRNNLTIQLTQNQNSTLGKLHLFDTTKENISLKSWVGSPEVFQECFEVISYANNKSNYERFNVKLPKGILLEGPPGVGKTLLAKAIASETDSTFISVTGSEFVEVYVGVGASRVRKLFESARLNAPSIIFIDEIDAIGKKRHGGNGGGGSDERDQTLNQLLAEMDGFNNNNGILILAATNRKEILDKALLRPGRFDRLIKIGYPDKYSREKIIKLYLDEKKYVSKNINSTIISELTDGFSGAELKNLINEAAILAARTGSRKIMPKHIFDAIEKNVVGLVKNIETRNPETKFRISIHEVGHAFLVMYYSNYFDLVKISIKSTYNGAGGYTLYNDKSEFKNDGLYTKDMLKKKLIIMMGGKAAESIFYGGEKVSLGSTQDLKQANQLARKMIGLFGMGDNLETFYNQDVDGEFELYGTNSLNKYSEKIKQQFDIETINLVTDAFTEAKKIITDNKIVFEELVDLLAEKEILNLSEILHIFTDIK